MTPKLFSELGLSPELLKAIDRLGFEQASPIQAHAIPVLLQGRDVVGQSQTGSGKTAAFAIPAIEKTNPQQRAVQVLILCPTRELAVQVSEDVHKLALFKRGIQALPIYGGQSYERQFSGLKQGAQIVIGTPGRVMDHMRRDTLKLNSVRMVVLDEADVMLDMGFREDIELILQSVPIERQTVFFSATMPRPIRELIERFARDPVTVEMEQKALTVPTVEQAYYEVDRRFKVELLTRLIDLHDYKLGIVFCNTKRMVDDLVDHLHAQGYSADRLHGDMTQAMRDRVMQKFRKSGLEFLVATDVAARGIDVHDVQVVFNYDLPYDPEDYVHRIGRTGRAGRAGRAISFVAGRELFQIQQIERFTKTRIHRTKIPTVEEVEEARAVAVLDRLRATLQNGDFKHQDHLLDVLLEEGFTSTDVASALIHLLRVSEGGRNEAAPQAEIPERRRRDDSHREERDRQSPRRPPSGRERTPPERREQFRPIQRPERSRPIDVRPRREPPSAGSVLPVRDQPIEKSAFRPGAKAARTPEQTVPARPATQPEAGPSGPNLSKPSRRTPEGQTRLHMNIGAEMGIEPQDVVHAIMGQTGLSPQVVGAVDVRDRHLFVDVATAHAAGIVAKLKRCQIKGRKVHVKLAS